MASEREHTTLGALADAGVLAVQTGPFGSQLHSHEYVTHGVPVIPTEAIGRRRLKTATTPQIGLETANRLSRHRVSAGDILFARRGAQATGLSAIAEDCHNGWICGTGALRLRIAKPHQVHPGFLSWALAGDDAINWLKAHAVGAVMPNLNEEVIRGLPVIIPPPAEQKRIAEILGTLDDKIELNRRMNATLEAMARALFQSWFVDFDPVRAKAAGKTPARMDQATADLFPSTLADSALGEIPKGWRVERFEQHLSGERGLSYNGDGLRGDGTGLPMHNLNSIYEGGGYKHEGLKFYDGEYRDKHLLNAGDMIITNTEQGHEHRLIGFAAIVPSCYGPTGLFSHHIYRIRALPGSPLDAPYLVQLFNNRRWHKIIAGYSNGTSINMLPPDALKAPPLVAPPVALVRKYSAFATAAHARIESNIAESRTLAALRDALLPKLLSGELLINSANVEAAI